MPGREAVPRRPDPRRPPAAVIHSPRQGRTHPQRRVRPRPQHAETAILHTMTTWTLTTTAADRHNTVIGAGDTPEQAREQLITATHAMMARAGDGRPRYTLHLAGQLAAIIQTSDDELGLPDHARAAELLTFVRQSRNPFSE